MDTLLEFLGTPLVAISNQSITVGQVLVVPAVVLAGFFLIRWGGRLITSRLTARDVNADLVQLGTRAFLHHRDRHPGDHDA